MPIGTTVTTNLSLRQAIANSLVAIGPVIPLIAGGGSSSTTQAGATPLRCGVNSVIGSPVPAGSCILPSILSNETSAQITIVINDSPSQSVAVFSAPGERMNATLNGSQLIAPGGFGIFIMKPQDPSVGGTPPGWSAAAFT